MREGGRVGDQERDGPLEVLLAGARPDGVRLEALAGLDWVGFPRTDSPAWYDEIVAILRNHGLNPGPPAGPGQSLIAEVEFAAVAAGARSRSPRRTGPGRCRTASCGSR